MGKIVLPIRRRTPRRLRVVVALVLSHAAGQRKLSGIFAHIGSSLNWDVQLFRTQAEIESAGFLRALDEPVDGVIYSADPVPAVTARLRALPCPVVRMEHEAALKSRRQPTAFVRNDPDALAKSAVDFFRHLGRFRSFAFAHAASGDYWSVDRGKAFAAHVPKGVPLRILAPTRQSGREDKRQIVDFLGKLALPAALLAANDVRAADVVGAAREAGIAIPNQLSVLGIDNDPYVCDNTRPGISSIEPNHFAEGRAAAELLDRMMRRARAGVQNLRFGVRQIVVRASTQNQPPALSLVEHAQRYIDAHATEGIGPDDVARALGISRPLLYLRFKEVSAKSPHRLIVERKLEKVRQLLTQTDVAITSITSLCGFANVNALKNLFRKETGLSMSAYRLRARNAAARSRLPITRRS